ncbi:alkaline phosphatase family protein [bacterium]|nr:alkaline phosphatase family protein [candidate division CSSED10-310 bacterium]
MKGWRPFVNRYRVLLVTWIWLAGCTQISPGDRQDPQLPEKLLIFGMDAASWRVMDPICEKGYLPTIRGLIDRGTKKDLETLTPTVSVMLWTTIATGMYPEKHGIKSWLVEGADTSGQLAITSDYRRVKAIWNWSGRYRYLFSNWWATWPAETIHGVMISNRAHFAYLNHTIHPPEYRSVLERIQPVEKSALETELTELNPLGNRIILSGFTYEQLKKDRFYLDTAAEILSGESFDITGLFVRGIDILEHEFLHQVIPSDSPPQDDENTKGIVLSYYRYLDLQLNRFIRLMGENTAIVLVSDHGMDPVEILPPLIEGLNIDKLLNRINEETERTGQVVSGFRDSRRYPPGLTRTLSWNGTDGTGAGDIRSKAARLCESLGKVTYDSHPLFETITLGEDPAEIIHLTLCPEPSRNSGIIVNGKRSSLMEFVDLIIHPKSGQHWHAPPGIFLVSGPGIRHNTGTGTIRILDVAPTIAAILGIPLARDMDGIPQTDCFRPELLRSRPVQWIESRGLRDNRAVSQSDPQVDMTVKEELRNLGYIR